MLISIDPGVNNCGFAVIDTNLPLKVLQTLNVKNIRKFSESEKKLEQEFSARVVKVSHIAQNCEELLEKYGPVEKVIIEAPFYNALTPLAYGSLLEVITALKYKIFIPKKIPFFMVEPTLVKKMFSSVGHARKEYLKNLLYQKKESGEIVIEMDIETLTEHEIDAIAVGYAHIVQTSQSAL